MGRFRALDAGTLKITAGVEPEFRQHTAPRGTLAVGTGRVYDVTQILSVFDNRYMRLAVFQGETAEGYTFYALAEVGMVTGMAVAHAAIEVLDADPEPSPTQVLSDLFAAYRDSKLTQRV